MKKLELLKNCLQQVINNIDAGNSYLDEEKCEEIMDCINRMTMVENKYSIYQACEYLGISRPTYDRYVKEGIISKGRKQQGFKELFYYKKDLDDAKCKIIDRQHNSNSTDSTWNNSVCSA